MISSLNNNKMPVLLSHRHLFYPIQNTAPAYIITIPGFRKRAFAMNIILNDLLLIIFTEMAASIIAMRSKTMLADNNIVVS